METVKIVTLKDVNGKDVYTLACTVRDGEPIVQFKPKSWSNKPIPLRELDQAVRALAPQQSLADTEADLRSG